MIPDDFLNAAMLETEPVPKADGGQRWGALAAIVSIAAGLRLWRLDQNGFGNFYYAAAVRSMLESWSNFFFGSFDPAGFVTVDKPPVAIWIQAISAKLLGFRGVSLLLPEALMGTISVVLTYHLVRRVFGTGAGLLAGLMLAITPICVAVDRDNLPDSALVLVLMLAAWAVTIAAEAGRLKPLLLAAALVGVGFNIKMLAAFVVLPTFYLCYLVAAPVNWRTRLAHLTAATIVLVAVSLSWSIAVELTPKSQRPYIGGSRNDSALDLALGYNGLGRVLGGSGNFRPGGPGGPGRFPGAGTPPTKDAETPAKEKAVDAEKPNTKDGEKSPVAGPGLPDQASPPSPPVGVAKAVSPAEPEAGFPPGGPGPGTGAGFPPGGPFPGGRFPAGMPPMFGGTPGLLRFTIPLMAAQITWLFPIALIGAGVASARVARRWPIAAEHLSLLLWAGWLGTHWVVFSFAQGIFHEYYTTIMGPAVAALAGIGVVALYEEWRRSDGHHGYLPTALILTAAWQAYIVSQFPEIRKYLLPALGSGIVISAIGLVGARWLTARRGSVPWTKLATGLGLTAILIGPACWSLGTVIAPGNSMMPAANPSALTGGRDTGSAMPPMPPFGQDLEQSDKLIAFLRANHHGERILVAGPASMEIAPIIIRTGETAVSLGGFMGGDPVLTKDEFAKLVEEGQVRFVLIGGGPGGGMPFPPGGGPPGGGMPGGGPPGGMPFPPGGPGGPGNSEVMAWVREHGKAVDSKLWQADEKPEDAEPKEEAGGPGGPGGPPGGMPNFFRRMRRMAKLYDCKPELGLVQPADVTK